LVGDDNKTSRTELLGLRLESLELIGYPRHLGR